MSPPHAGRQRIAPLAQFLHTLEAAIDARLHSADDAFELTRKIRSALREPHAPVTLVPGVQPSYSLLDDVVGDLAERCESADQTHRISTHVVDHARSIAALAGQLSWWRRPDAERVGEPFLSNHMNATVVGPGGIEPRDDVWIGISLMAPGIHYPEHHHPPEELYLVLSPGQWQQAGGGWHEPGPGGLVHNPPDILHAMRSGQRPLLATWCLWTGSN